MPETASIATILDAEEIDVDSISQCARCGHSPADHLAGPDGGMCEIWLCDCNTYDDSDDDAADWSAR